MSEEKPLEKPLYIGPSDGEYLETDSVGVFGNTDGTTVFTMPVYALRGTDDFYVRQRESFVRIDENAENFQRYEKKLRGASTLHEEIQNAEKEFASALDQQHRNRRVEEGPQSDYTQKMQDAWSTADRRTS